MRKNNTRERIYQYIIGFIIKNGYSPTVREIAEGVDLASTSSVVNHLIKLESCGLIKTKDFSPRSISLIGYEFVKKVF